MIELSARRLGTGSDLGELGSRHDTNPPLRPEERLFG